MYQIFDFFLNVTELRIVNIDEEHSAPRAKFSIMLNNLLNNVFNKT
jgi:hypothetical protein